MEQAFVEKILQIGALDVGGCRFGLAPMRRFQPQAPPNQSTLELGFQSFTTPYYCTHC
jgi:hypothetical protein